MTPKEMITFAYDREKAVAYADYWAYRRNPDYLDFAGIGGDCTNFASQCIYAGSGVMNYTPTYGWYYITANDRTASWTGVEYFYEFLTTNQSLGPFGTNSGIGEIEPGDIVQLGDNTGDFYHTLVITTVPENPNADNILIAAHSNDSNCRPLSTYSFGQARFIHILGVRTEPPEQNTGEPEEEPLQPPVDFTRPLEDARIGKRSSGPLPFLRMPPRG